MEEKVSVARAGDRRRGIRGNEEPLTEIGNEDVCGLSVVFLRKLYDQIIRQQWRTR